jgi:hypothetical protein
LDIISTPEKFNRYIIFEEEVAKNMIKILIEEGVNGVRKKVF